MSGASVCGTNLTLTEHDIVEKRDEQDKRMRSHASSYTQQTILARATANHNIIGKSIFPKKAPKDSNSMEQGRLIVNKIESIFNEMQDFRGFVELNTNGHELIADAVIERTNCDEKIRELKAIIGQHYIPPDIDTEINMPAEIRFRALKLETAAKFSETLTNAESAVHRFESIVNEVVERQLTARSVSQGSLAADEASQHRNFLNEIRDELDEARKNQKAALDTVSGIRSRMDAEVCRISLGDIKAEFMGKFLTQRATYHANIEAQNKAKLELDAAIKARENENLYEMLLSSYVSLSSELVQKIKDIGNPEIESQLKKSAYLPTGETIHDPWTNNHLPGVWFRLKEEYGKHTIITFAQDFMDAVALKLDPVEMERDPASAIQPLVQMFAQWTAKDHSALLTMDILFTILLLNNIPPSTLYHQQTFLLHWQRRRKHYLWTGLHIIRTVFISTLNNNRLSS